MQTAWDWIHERTTYVWSRENANKFASKSEKKRWLMNSAVVINNEKVTWDEIIDFPVHSVVLFPKGKRITLW